MNSVTTPITRLGPKRAALPQWGGSVLIAGALLAGVSCMLLSRHVIVAVALLVAAAFMWVLVARPLTGLLLWVPTLFFDAVPALNLAAKLGGVAIAAVWFGSSHGRRVSLVAFRENRPVSTFVLAVLGWLTLSSVWAVSPAQVFADLWHWYAVALILVLVMSVSVHERSLPRLLALFVLGGVLSVVDGFFAGGFSTAAATAGTPGRLESGAGDPNFLGAWLLAATVLAWGSAVAARRSSSRLALGIAGILCAAGVAATLSRGAFVAAATTGAAALVVVSGARGRIAALLAGLGAALVGWFVAFPAASARLFAENRGSGREDLWAVAARVAQHHPLLGVGLNNYQVVEGSYANQVAPIPYVGLVLGRPHEVHNTYLQLLAEVGVVGAALFIALVIASLAAGLSGSRTFLSKGARTEAILGYAVFLATLSMAVSSVFLSLEVDKRLWLLLALGPVVKTLARESRPAELGGIRGGIETAASPPPVAAAAPGPQDGTEHAAPSSVVGWTS